MMSSKLWKSVLAAAALMTAGSYAYAQSAHDPAAMHGSMSQHQPVSGDMTHAPATMGHQAEIPGQPTLPG